VRRYRSVLLADVAECHRLRATGLSIPRMARSLDLSESTVWRILAGKYASAPATASAVQAVTPPVALPSRCRCNHYAPAHPVNVRGMRMSCVKCDCRIFVKAKL